MPILDFVANEFGAAKSVEVLEAVDLVDICDEALAPIPFSCRSASCATCQIEILEGSELLEDPGLLEQELLEILHAPATHRLACQVRVKSGQGTIRLRPVGE